MLGKNTEIVFNISQLVNQNTLTTCKTHDWDLMMIASDSHGISPLSAAPC